MKCEQALLTIALRMHVNFPFLVEVVLHQCYLDVQRPPFPVDPDKRSNSHQPLTSDDVYLYMATDTLS